jgi:hypothetical protein
MSWVVPLFVDQALISSTRVLVPGYTLFYYMVDAQHFFSLSSYLRQNTYCLKFVDHVFCLSKYLIGNTVSQLYRNHCNRSMTSLDRIVIGCDALGHSVNTTSFTQGKLDSGPSYEGATYSNIHALTYSGVTP